MSATKQEPIFHTVNPCAAGIRAHPCIAHIPEWPDNGWRMKALRREMQMSGICQAVQMTARHEIVDADSRERWRVARSLKLEQIPVAVVADQQVASACLNALAHRRHLTRGAIAYLAVPLLETAFKEAQERARELLKKGRQAATTVRPAKTIEEMAENLGVSGSLLREARTVRRIFVNNPEFKVQMEPRILIEAIGGEHEQNRPVGLGAVIAGFAGKQNEDKERACRTSLERFEKAVKALCIRAPKVEDDEAAREIVRAELEKISADERVVVQRTATLIVSEARLLEKFVKV